MVDPADVPRVVTDVARLVREGELIVFGSAALAFTLDAAPTSRDVYVYCIPPEHGDAVEALMGECSWYHDRHGVYVEVWGPETFAAPVDWRRRARVMRLEELPALTVLVPHSHDVLCSKLERFEERDIEHARLILAQHPMDAAELAERAQVMPHRTGAITDPDRIRHFEHGLGRLERMLSR